MDPDERPIGHGKVIEPHAPMIKPPRLRAGDKVVAVSLSWGGPGKFPHRYQAGKEQFERGLGCRVVETRHALRDPACLADHPEARAQDLMEAFADTSVRGIISTIGGDDRCACCRTWTSR